MKRFLIICALLVTLLLIFTACQVPSTNTGDSTASTDESDTNTTDSTDKPSVKPCQEHTYGEWVTVKAATCAETGLRKRTCSICGYVYEDVISLTLHTQKAVGRVDATCTVDGHTSGTVCSVCGYVIFGCEPIAAKGHKIKDDQCTVCGEPSPIYDAYVLVYANQKDNALADAIRACGIGVKVSMVSEATEIEYGDFDLVIFDGVAPVELPEGKSVWYINTPTLPSGIGAYGSEVNSSTGAAILANTYNKTGKQITNKLTLTNALVGAYMPFDNTGSGMASVLMANGKAIMVAGELDGAFAIATGFSFSNTNLPLQVADFVTLVHNMVEYSILGILPEAEACKHAQQSIKGYDATCTEDGLTSSIVCSKCGEVLIPAEVKPAKGHKYDENGVCKNCGETKPE